MKHDTNNRKNGYYNGLNYTWTNYETYATYFRLRNSKGPYNVIEDIVKTYSNIDRIADEIGYFVRQSLPYDAGEIEDLYSDFITSCLNKINYKEIAVQWVKSRK